MTPERLTAVPVAEIIRSLEGEAANTDTDPRWLAAKCLREIAGWESRQVFCRVPPEATGIYESAWVIEGSWSSTACPEYWVGSSAWSSDPYKALRFASKQSAQQAADMMLVGINHRVACHEFAGNSHHE